MKPLVLDASAALAYVLGEPDAQRVRRELLSRDAVLAPWSMWSEVINSLARRHHWPGSDVLGAVYDLEQLGIRTEPPSRPTMLAVIDAVEAHGLTAYDAEYLVLAEMTDADLMTGDAILAAAAGTRAIRIGAAQQLAEAAVGYPQGDHVAELDWPRWPGAVAYMQQLRREARSDLEALRAREA